MTESPGKGSRTHSEEEGGALLGRDEAKPPGRSHRRAARGETAWWERVVMVAIMVPFVTVAMAVAGALLAAMPLATVSLDTEALARGVTVLLFGVLGMAPVAALAAALLAGGVTFLFDRDSVIAAAAAGGLFVFCGFALYATVLTALEISAAGCWVGAGLGGLLGIVAGVEVVKGDRSPKRLRRGADRRTGARGTHPAELEWWRGDLDGLDDDGD